MEAIMAHESYEFALSERLTCECGWEGYGDGLDYRYEDESFSHEFGIEERGFYIFTCPQCGEEMER
jgi:hypothetical protein